MNGRSGHDDLPNRVGTPAGRAVRGGLGPRRVRVSRRCHASDPAGDLPELGLGVRRALAGGGRRRSIAVRRDVARAGLVARAIRGRQQGNEVHVGSRPPGPRMEGQAPRVDPGRREGCELPPREDRRYRRAARRAGLPHRLGISRAGGHGVLQPGDSGARRRTARAARDGREPDRAVHRAEARRGGAGPVLRHVARHALHRRHRRLLQAREPGMGKNARFHARRAAVAPLRRRSSTPTIARRPRRRREASRRASASSRSRTATRARTARTNGCSGRPPSTPTSSGSTPSPAT